MATEGGDGGAGAPVVTAPATAPPVGAPVVTAPQAAAPFHLNRVELRDVRAFREAVVEIGAERTTILVGENGAGKTTILEAVASLGTQRSFRSATRDAMIRTGAERAIVRAELEREGRPLLVESELPSRGGARTLVNHRPVRDRTELARTVPVTVFSPDDLGLVQGAPARRRALLDDAISLLDPVGAAALDAFERALRQRAALLRQAHGRVSREIEATLDVWDERLVAHGGVVSASRARLAGDLGFPVAAAYASLAGGPPDAGSAPVAGSPPVVSLGYRAGWSGSLADALRASRADDLRRAVTTVGPQRDELSLEIAGRDARLHASQGEQRTLALALRLAVHGLVTERLEVPPILLLDDVFSELDAGRSRALVHHLPTCQTLLTSAGGLPEGIEAAAVIDVSTLGSRA